MNGRKLAINTGFAVLPVVISLAITALLVLLIDKDPIAVLETTLQGAFRNESAISGVVNFWIPLTLVSMGLIVTFRAGLWNIGIEGQMMMGAIFASWGALFAPLPPEAPALFIAVEIGLAMLGGMFWGLVVGFLKVKLGVHEIFGGVALNALANVYSIFLISGPWSPPEGGSAQSSMAFPSHTLLQNWTETWQFSLLAFIITIVAVIGVVLALGSTRWGLQLKATGKNPRSALLLGVPTDRTAFSAFLVCGALAGIAGSYRVLFTFDSLRPLASGGIGFLGLLVVLLVGMRGLWVPFVAFAFAAILTGSGALRVRMQLDSSLAGVLQGTVVLVVLLFSGIRERFEGRPDTVPDEPFAPIETEDTL